MITFLSNISQINWERKIRPNFFKYSPKVGIDLGTSIFFRPDSLLPSFPNLSFIKGVFRQREGTGYNCEPNDRERWPKLKFIILTGWVTSGQRVTDFVSHPISFPAFSLVFLPSPPPKTWKSEETKTAGASARRSWRRRREAEAGEARADPD